MSSSRQQRPSTDAPPLEQLRLIMAMLRDKARGCPWDVAQNFATIAPYTIEEAYEVADAIARHDMADLRDELGDLLLQVVFHARMAEEAGHFGLDDVARGIVDKLVRRHPHVFGDGADVPPADADVDRPWEAFKLAERLAKAASAGRRPCVLDDVPVGLPALTRADKLQKRVARVGFDWQEIDSVLAKIEEEIGEVRAALADGAARDKLLDETGDLLFCVANLARFLKVDPEAALRHTNEKFIRRFGWVESALARQGRSPEDASLEEMEQLWQRSKAEVG